MGNFLETTSKTPARQAATGARLDRASEIGKPLVNKPYKAPAIGILTLK
jgi:hypothetical protein